MTTREAVFLVLLMLLAITLAIVGLSPTKELTQAREKAAINFCVDNGGTAQFRYNQGADHLVFTGCTFSRGQERP